MDREASLLRCSKLSCYAEFNKMVLAISRNRSVSGISRIPGVSSMQGTSAEYHFYTTLVMMLKGVVNNNDPVVQKQELQQVYMWFCLNKPLIRSKTKPTQSKPKLSLSYPELERPQTAPAMLNKRHRDSAKRSTSKSLTRPHTCASSVKQRATFTSTYISRSLGNDLDLIGQPFDQLQSVHHDYNTHTAEFNPEPATYGPTMISQHPLTSDGGATSSSGKVAIMAFPTPEFLAGYNPSASKDAVASGSRPHTVGSMSFGTVFSLAPSVAAQMTIERELQKNHYGKLMQRQRLRAQFNQFTPPASKLGRYRTNTPIDRESSNQGQPHTHTPVETKPVQSSSNEPQVNQNIPESCQSQEEISMKGELVKDQVETETEISCQDGPDGELSEIIESTRQGTVAMTELSPTATERGKIKMSRVVFPHHSHMRSHVSHGSSMVQGESLQIEGQALAIRPVENVKPESTSSVVESVGGDATFITNTNTGLECAQNGSNDPVSNLDKSGQLTTTPINTAEANTTNSNDSKEEVSGPSEPVLEDMDNHDVRSNPMPESNDVKTEISSNDEHQHEQEITNRVDKVQESTPREQQCKEVAEDAFSQTQEPPTASDINDSCKQSRVESLVEMPASPTVTITRSPTHTPQIQRALTSTPLLQQKRLPMNVISISFPPPKMKPFRSTSFSGPIGKKRTPLIVAGFDKRRYQRPSTVHVSMK